MAQEAYTWTGDSEVWLKRPIRGHRGLRAKECAYINDNATDGASEKDTHPQEDDGLSKDGTSRESSIAQKNHSPKKIVGKQARRQG
jgi:hypothetical protein